MDNNLITSFGSWINLLQYPTNLSIELLNNIEINDKLSYDKCVDDMIKIFSPDYYGNPEEPNKIYTTFIIKKDGHWDYDK